jgi:hypothetical protein
VNVYGDFCPWCCWWFGVNTLSNDVGYRGADVVAAFAAILLSTNWLRQLPTGAPLARIASGALLGIAAIMVVAAAMNSRWEGLATIVATVLTTSAVLIQTDLDKAAGLLGGVAVIGVGVAVLRRSDLLSHALSWLISLTKDPGSKALQNGDSALSVPDNPPPGLMDTPRSEPPRNT